MKTRMIPVFALAINAALPLTLAVTVLGAGVKDTNQAPPDLALTESTANLTEALQTSMSLGYTTEITSTRAFTIHLPIIMGNWSAPTPTPPEGPAQGGRPLSEVEVLRMPPVDTQALLAEDEQRAAAGLPLRFAKPIEVQVDPSTNGTWEELDGGILLWRLRVRSPGAVSLNLGFSRYVMPPGGRLFLYTPDYSTIVGPFTDEDNEEHGQLWTPILPGDEIVIEVSLPSGVASQLELNLTSVNHGYIGFGLSQVTILSGACNVDVVCPEGDDWRDEIRSVARYTLAGAYLCTGSTINNTAQDLTPYFLTADHCATKWGLDWATSAPTMVFYWNYENSTCRTPGSAASGQPGDGSLSQSQTGAILRARYASSDMTLVELDDDPDAAFHVHWNGWDRTGADASSAVTIHHPRGHEKRISFENDPTTVTSYYGTSVPDDGTHIRVADWDLGTTESGSSGAPLFNSDHRVIGQLHGGDAACGNDDSDWYGRLFTSWTGGGASASRLMDWLDPSDTGATVLDGMDMVADLAVTKSDTPDPVIAGTDLIYSITVTNDGPADASEVTVTDTLPAEVTYVSDTAPGGCTEAPVSTLTCALGDLGVGESRQFDVTARVDPDVACDTGGPSTITNAAEAFSINPDTDLTDNTAWEDTLVIAMADLAITKSDSPDPAVAGEQLVYTLQMTNHGPSSTCDVRLVDTLPPGVAYVSDSVGCVEAPTGTLTCDLGGVLVGETRELTIIGLIDADLVYNADGPITITNQASVETVDASDPDLSNNSAAEDTLVIAAADLEIVSFEAVDPPAEVLVGEPLDITLRKVIANNGSSAPIDVELTKTATAPPDSIVTPAISVTAEAALGMGELRVVDEVFTIECGAASPHTFTFTNEIQPLNLEDTDPDQSNNFANLDLDIECVVPVILNIKPGSDPNSINPRSKDVIPVAVLTTSAGEYGTPVDFDATTIDPLSVRFGPRDDVWTETGGAFEAHNRGHIEDSKELDESTMDGDEDMVLHFKVRDTGIEFGDTEACVKGEWIDEGGDVHRFFGCDAVRTVGE